MEALESRAGPVRKPEVDSCPNGRRRLTGMKLFHLLLLLAMFAVNSWCISAVDAKGCNKTIRTTRIVKSPKVTRANKDRPLTCVYSFLGYGDSKATSVFELVVQELQVGQVYNETYCAGGYLQLVEHQQRLISSSNIKHYGLPLIEAQKHEIKEGFDAAGLMCGKTRRSRTYLAEAVSVTLVFHADKFTRQTRFKVRSSVLPHRLAKERHKEMASPNQGLRVPDTRCDRVFIDCLGHCDLMSPGYPGFYPRNVTCIYTIIFNNTDTRVTLGGHYLDKFDVWGAPGFQGHRLSSSFCPHDRLRVYEDKYSLSKTQNWWGASQNERNFIGQFCGRGTLPRIVSKGNRVTVVFVSSPAGTPFSDGFRLSVGSERRPTSGHTGRVSSNKWGQEMLANGSCDWWLNSDEVLQGVISSLRHWYPPGTKCSFNFRGKTGEKIWIHFQGFSSHRNIGTGSRGGCPDRLRIYDSDSASSDKLVGDFCAGSSRRPNETLTSTSEKAYVVFESSEGSHDGSQFDFSAYFMFFNGTPPKSAVPGTACDQLFDVRTSRNGLFDLLPDRLQLRKQQLECTIIFSSTSPSDRIRLVLDDVRLDPVKQCPFPYQRAKRDTISTVGLNTELPKKRSTCDETRVNPHDHVAAYDTDGSLLECLCADADKKVEIVSKGPRLKILLRLYHIHYLAHREPTAFVFRGKYETIAAICGTPTFGANKDGQRLTASGSGEISYRTPLLGNRGYYKNYSGRENATCRWSIEATPGTAVVVKIISLTLPGNCTEASVSFYQEDGQSEPYAQLCGGHQSKPVEVMPPRWTSKFEGLHTSTGRVYGQLESLNKISIVFRAKTGAQVFFRLRWSQVRVRDSKGPRCEFQCPDNRTCLAFEQLCDGYIDCPQANFIGDPLDEGPSVCGGQYGSEYFVACLLTASVVSAGVVTSAACAVICLWKKKESKNIGLSSQVVDSRITRTKTPLLSDQSPQPSTSRLNSTRSSS